MAINYVKVKVKGEKRSFWAIREKKSKNATLYKLVHRDGGDYSYKNKEGNYILPKRLISNSLITEIPAVMDRHYGELKINK